MRKKIVNSLITATVIGSMLTGMAVPCFAGGKRTVEVVLQFL